MQAEATGILENLKSSSFKIREFEEENGRPPSEDEIAAIESINLEHTPTSPIQVRQSKIERRLLEEELAQSQAQVKQLEERLDDLTEKLQQFSSDGDEQGDKVNAATEAARTEHANKMRDMSSANQARLDHLRMIHREELDELRTQHEEELMELTKRRNSETIEKDAELVSLREQIETLTEQVARMENQQSELEQLNIKYESVESDKAASQAELEELRGRVRELGALSTQIEDRDQEIGKLQSEIARLSTNSDLDDEPAANSDVASEGATSIDLRKELERLRSEYENHLTDTNKSHKLALAELERKHEEAIERAHRDLQSTHSNLAQRDAELKRFREEHSADIDRLTKVINMQKEALKQADSTKDELVEKNGELAAANDKIIGLEQRVVSLQHHIDTSKDQSSKTTRDLQQQIEHKDAEVEKQAETVKQLQQLMQYKTEQHEKAMDNLNSTHAKRLKQLEDDGLASLASLEAIETANNTRAEKLQAEHVEEKEKALTSLRDEHLQTSTNLRKQLEDLRKQLDDTKNNHQADLDQLQSVHRSSQDRALQALRDEHAEKVKGLEEQLAAQSKNEEVENEHKRKVEELEAQVQMLSSQAQNASFQVQTMRHVIRSNDEEAQQRIKELETELESTQGQFSQAVVRISQNSYQMSQLQAELQRERTAQETEHEETIANLKQQIQSSEHELQVVAEAHQADLSSLQLGHKDALSRLEKDHATKLADLKADLEATASEARDGLIKTHQVQITQQQEQLAGLEAQLSSVNAKMTAMDQVKAQLASARQELDISQSEHDEVVTNLKGQLSQLQAIVETPASSSHETELQAELNSTRRKLEEMVQLHDGGPAENRAQHETVLKQTQSESDDIRSKSQPARDAEIAEMEATMTRTTNANAVLTKQVVELRSTIDQLNDELEALRQYAADADTQNAEIQRPTTMQAHSGRTYRGSGTAKSSPRVGLSSSKWAAIEESPSTTNETEIDAERDAVYPLRRSSVHGQLASINEDIRSLNNLSEQMLAQNRLMARTLSRVDAYTGVIGRT